MTYKTVDRTNAEVAHRWAQRPGDTPKRKARQNVFYEGDTIYSYGHHFPMAKHYTSPKGEHFVAFTTQTYSSTTAKHLCTVRHAINHLRVVRVNDPGASPREWVQDLLERLATVYGSWKRARVHKDIHLDVIGRLQKDLTFLNDQYDLGFNPESWGTEGDVSREIAEAVEREQARRREEQRKRDEQAKERIARWVSGDGDYAPHTAKVYMRVKDGYVETSWGAKVTLEDAQRLWEAVKYRDTTQDVRMSVPAGDFTLYIVYADGDIKVGCHHIGYDESLRIARQLGWVKEEEA